MSGKDRAQQNSGKNAAPEQSRGPGGGLDSEAAMQAAAASFDAAGVARNLLRTIRAGALATVSEDGFPFASLVNVATAMDGTPILLMSSLSAHTRHLLAESRASLLLSQGGKGDPLAHPRLTVTGSARRIDAETPDGAAEREVLRARFLARHPKSALYADFGDFAFWRLEIVRGHLNGGFARAAELAAADLVCDLSGAEELPALEAGALEHMNADHAEAVRLYASVLCGEGKGQWRATGLDPEGLDMAAGDRTARVAFPVRVTGAAGLRKALADLARTAREMPEKA